VAKREQARIEAAFMRGDVGVDGQATEEQRDEAEVEKDKAREQLLRGRTYLGRELLSWLLWRSESGESLVEYEERPVTVLFTSKVVLKGVHEDVTEMTARGATAPYSSEVRHALDRGLLVHSARLCFTHGDRQYEATLDAEHLDVRSAKLPQLMTEEEDDTLQERLYLVEQLSGIVDALVEAFLAVRTSKRWRQKIVPAMKEWMQGSED
jgi:hypothetical protein